MPAASEGAGDPDAFVRAAAGLPDTAAFGEDRELRVTARAGSCSCDSWAAAGAAIGAADRAEFVRFRPPGRAVADGWDPVFSSGAAT